MTLCAMVVMSCRLSLRYQKVGRMLDGKARRRIPAMDCLRHSLNRWVMATHTEDVAECPVFLASVQLMVIWLNSYQLTHPVKYVSGL